MFQPNSAIYYTYRWPHYPSTVDQEGAPATVYVNDSPQDEWEITGFEYRIDIDSNKITVEFLSNAVEWAIEDSESFVGSASFNGINFSFDSSKTGSPESSVLSDGVGIFKPTGKSQPVALSYVSAGNLAIDWKGMDFSGVKRLSWIPFNARNAPDVVGSPSTTETQGEPNPQPVEAESSFNDEDPYNSLSIIAQTERYNDFQNTFKGRTRKKSKGRRRARKLGDVLTGSSQNDVIIGTAYADKMYGGDGNDVLTGSGGSDEMHGGGGSNRYNLEGLAKGNNDVLYITATRDPRLADYVSGFRSTNRIYLTGSAGPVSVESLGGTQYGIYDGGVLQALVLAASAGSPGFLSSAEEVARTVSAL